MSEQPRPSLPDRRDGTLPGVQLRAAHSADGEAVARVFVDCWKGGYHGILPVAYAERLSYEDQAELWHRVIITPGNATWVAVDRDDQVLGFVAGGPERSGSSAYFAEIYGLYVLPAWRGQQLGRRLLQAVTGQLAAIGLRSLLVRVLEANPTAGFYEYLGGVPQDLRPVRVAGRSLNEVAYGWRDVMPLSRGLTPGKTA